MAIRKNNIIEWNDIKNLYTSLNAQKSRFGQQQIAVPTNQNKVAKVTDASNLISAIESMASISWITSTAFTGATIPSVGDLITPDLFNKAKTTIDNISGVCIHFSGNNGFSAFVTFSDNNSFGDDVTFGGNNSFSADVTFSSNNSFSANVTFSGNNSFGANVSFTSNVDFCRNIDFGSSC